MYDTRPTQPPPVRPAWPLYRGRLPGKSHLHRYRGYWLPLSQNRLTDSSGCRIGHNHHGPLSQQLLQQIMDSQGPCQRGIESDDESFQLDDYLHDELLTVDANMQSVRSQTTTQPVSLANCGRDITSSHPQYSKKAVPGNEQVLFPGDPAANAYAHDMAGSFSQQQFQYPSYSPNDLGNPNLGNELQHGLPSFNELYSNMSVFSEPFEFEFPHVGPATLPSSFSSSAGSSIASEKLASMTLEPGPHGRITPLGSRSSHYASSAGIRGQPPILPKIARADPSLAQAPSTETLQTSMPIIRRGSDIGASAQGRHEARSGLPTVHSNHKARKELPTKPIKPRLAQLSPSGCEPVASKGKSKAQVQQQIHQSPLQYPTEPTQATLIPKDHLTVEVDGSTGTVASSSTHADRDARNRFLVESRLAGMSYREIRQKGGFTEAESTLRGRFRTLTKNKEQRVRKPEWQDKDIRLLKKAVRKLSKGDGTSAKVPWKQVAAYIYEHDGSYHFGNSTCRKKWDDLVEQEATELP